ncbi:MAG: FoF1 ATP synthase subunit gamma [Patescibacteria group bacterium]
MRLTKKQIHQQIEGTKTIRELMNAYEEIAALRMKRIRQQVVKSRDFHKILTHYFHEIRYLPKVKGQPVLQSPETFLAILLSDDKGLYGEILAKTKDSFVQFAKANPDYQLAVIGTQAQESIKEELPDRNARFFSLHTTPLTQDLKDIAALLTQFSHIVVFHGEFVNLINQIPAITYLTGEEDVPEAPQTTNQYLLEPSHESLLTFFQKEIVSVLLDQAILEGTLSKEASRMVSLEKASEEARNKIKRLKRLSRVINAQRQNKEQITYLAGLSLWNIH